MEIGPPDTVPTNTPWSVSPVRVIPPTSETNSIDAAPVVYKTRYGYAWLSALPG